MCVFSSILVEKTISQRTDKLHQPNVWGTPSLATISYVRDLKLVPTAGSLWQRSYHTLDYDDIIRTKSDNPNYLLLAESPGLSPSGYCITKS